MTKNLIFKETDIRPDKYIKEQKKLYKIDVKNLLKNKKDFVDMDCPACGGDKNKLYFKKYTLNYTKCSFCGTVFVNPRPTPGIIKNFLENSENYKFWNKYIFPASEIARREKIFRPRAELVKKMVLKYKLKRGTLMDMGAGFGTFCEEIKKMGIFKKIIAVEPTPELAETCKKKGLEVIQKMVENIDIKNKTDIITNFEVIEHLFSPKDFINQCKILLPRNGIIMMTAPNLKGLDLNVLGKISDIFDTEHLNYFHIDSISILLSRCGFEVIHISTPGRLDAELIRKKVLSGEYNIENQPFLKKILIEQWEEMGGSFQDFISRNFLSSNMFVVAKKL